MFSLKSKKAFTIVEVLVSIFIFIIITSFVIANYKKGENSNAFRLSAFDVEDAIKATQNMAFTGKKINNMIPSNAYGINFYSVNNSYTFFGDRNDGCIDLFNRNDTSFICNNGDVPDIISEVNFLPKDIYIYSLCGYPSGNNIDNLNIFFYAPKANMKIITHTYSLGNAQEPENCGIVLKSKKAPGTWSIRFSTTTNQIYSEFNN